MSESDTPAKPGRSRKRIALYVGGLLLALGIGASLGGGERTDSTLAPSSPAVAVGQSTPKATLSVTIAPTPTPTPTPTAEPDTGFRNFGTHMVTSMPPIQAAMESVGDAAGNYDVRGVIDGLSDLARLAQAESEWLDANPARPCFQALHASYSDAIDYFLAAGTLGQEAWKSFDQHGIEMTISLMNKGSEAIEDATDDLVSAAAICGEAGY